MNKMTEDFVTIYFEGLMLCCFNPNENRFETAIMRQDNHDFTVRIVEYDGDNKVTDDTHTNIPDQNVQFNFEGSGNTEVQGCSSFQNGEFVRQDESICDPNDFRWLVDLESEEFHNSKVEPTGESLSKHKMPLNKIYVKNAKFCVEQLTYYTTDKTLEDENGNLLSKEFFGKYGYVLSAKINADEVYMNFEGTQIPKLEVKRDNGLSYKVFITNTREGGDEENELPVYYKVLKHPSNQRFNLEKSEDLEVELYHRHNNCGKMFLSKTQTLDGFS